MESEIVSELGVERTDGDRPLTAEHGPFADGGEHIHAGADTLDRGRPDEHGVEGTIDEPTDLEIGLERVTLAPERVAPHGDVDGTQTLLVGAAVENLGREQDHPSAGTERGQTVRQPACEWFAESRRIEQERHRRRFAARKNDGVNRSQGLR